MMGSMRAGCVALSFFAAVAVGEFRCVAAEKAHPLMRDFMGLCVHTVQFKPALYAPITHLVRDYHPLRWDVGDDTSFPAQFPLARNRVDWLELYGDWVKAGYRIDADLMFDDIDPKAWKNVATDAFQYGEAFARYFGPAGKNLVECLEIGNEPGNYDDATYREIFENMARGARKGDPRLRIATCAANLGKSGRYSKSVDGLSGLESLYDVLNVHIYPEVEGWPTWRRSYPEDPQIGFLRDLHHVLTWRDQNVPEKEVWLTEFGWDASTKPAPEKGDFVKWEGSSEVHQAEWIVRGYMVLAASGVDRAYLFFFNDEDEPHVHGSSGLTRNFQPKPAYYAVGHLQSTLGDFRLAKVIREDQAEGFVYEFQRDGGFAGRIWAAWKTHGPDGAVTLPVDASAIEKAERMPLSASGAEAVNWEAAGEAATTVTVGEAPVYLWLK
jgi:hypothetical protein